MHMLGSAPARGKTAAPPAAKRPRILSASNRDVCDSAAAEAQNLLTNTSKPDISSEMTPETGLSSALACLNAAALRLEAFESARLMLPSRLAIGKQECETGTWYYFCLKDCREVLPSE